MPTPTRTGLAMEEDGTEALEGVGKLRPEAPRVCRCGTQRVLREIIKSVLERHRVSSLLG